MACAVEAGSSSFFGAGINHMTRDKDPRLVEVPLQHLSFVSQTVAEFGLAGATKKLRLSRTAILQVLAMGKAMPGSLALLREAYAQRAA
jgi:hypothetical protein